jgi:hypothetical protein
MTSAQRKGGRARRHEADDKAHVRRDERGKEHPSRKTKNELDKELDTALEDSFPSSDPPSSSQP